MRFRTETDTEVLLTAFAEWGKECLPRLNGMFHFAVWDNRERKLTLARDHVGIKPLYYFHQPASATQPGSLIFSSEVKAILASGLVERALDPEALNQFLTFLWAPDPNTLFQGIKTVPPAHVLTFHDNRIKLDEWWDISFDEIEEGRSEAWWREQTLETLDDVVRMEMIADVPLGSFLSGGIDSSGIVAMMKRHGNGRRVSTYTVGIEAEDLRYDIIPDDLEWARRVNQHLDTDYHEIMLQSRGRRVVAEAGLSHGRAGHRYGDPELPGLASGAQNVARDVVRYGRRRSVCRLSAAARDEDSRRFRSGADDAAASIIRNVSEDD